MATLVACFVATFILFSSFGDATMRRYQTDHKSSRQQIPFDGSAGRVSSENSEPTFGVPWPMPQQMTLTTTNLSASYDQLTFSTTYQCDILTQAMARYKQLIFVNNASGGNMQNFAANGNVMFTSLKIVVDQPCEQYPYLGMNENYTLSVWANGTGLLHSGAIWGALRGLETFSHMFYTIDQTNWLLRVGDIADFPRFAHRGILLDTSRHWLSVPNILKNIDLMAQNKFNVFHWHIVDDQSFPYVSLVFPALSVKGAYTAKHVYTPTDVANVVEYARVRGVRVMPEFDTPGHTLSWGYGQPGLLTPCYEKGKPDGNYGPIDPTYSPNYDFLTALFTEILTVFPDHYVHLGGDEVSFDCWASNPNIRKFMELQGYGQDYSKLEQYYIQNLLWLVLRARNNTGYAVWQEVVDNGVQVKPDTVVHVWKGNTQADWGPELAKWTGQGLRAMLSSCWYLNYISYGVDWYPYYQCDPQNFNGTQAQKDLVMGGEACMWGEYVDDTNLIPRLWPRASPVAERLWSSASLTDPNAAVGRLVEHRCRLLRRGYPVESINGPGFCPIEWTL